MITFHSILKLIQNINMNTLKNILFSIGLFLTFILLFFNKPIPKNNNIIQPFDIVINNKSLSQNTFLTITIFDDTLSYFKTKKVLCYNLQNDYYSSIDINDITVIGKPNLTHYIHYYTFYGSIFILILLSFFISFILMLNNKP